MEKDYHGLCDQITQDKRQIGCHMGNGRQVHEIRPFPANKGDILYGMTDDNLHQRDCETPWSTNLHHLRPR